MTQTYPRGGEVVSAAELAAAISATDFSGCSATVVGYGNMGRQFVKALRALGVQHIRVCSLSGAPLQELRDMIGVETVAGGFERLQCQPTPGELGIVAVPTGSLVAAAERLVSLGFRRLLIEKPVSLWSSEIEALAETLESGGVEAACGYNRVAYPSYHELRARASTEGGVTSCTYTFTEMIKPDWTERYPAEELARWGIANSLHVISMAHRLIGMPTRWSGYWSGALPWHPSGTVFVGSGISDLEIPFTYHADWGSTGRWSVELHTSVSSYRLCPIEKLFRKTSATGEWEEIALASLAPDVKVGFVEEVAAMLAEPIGQVVSPVSLREAVMLTEYGERVFGYGGVREQLVLG